MRKGDIMNKKSLIAVILLCGALITVQNVHYNKLVSTEISTEVNKQDVKLKVAVDKNDKLQKQISTVLTDNKTLSTTIKDQNTKLQTQQSTLLDQNTKIQDQNTKIKTLDDKLNKIGNPSDF